MLSSFWTCLRSLARDRALLVWPLAFPILMTCVFMAMFSGVSNAYSIVGSRLGVVNDAHYQTAVGLDQTLQAISDTGSDDHICDLTYYASEKDALAAARAGDVDEYLVVDQEGTPQLHISPDSLGSNGKLPTSVLLEVLNAYVHLRNSIFGVAARQPDLLVSGAALQAFRANAVHTVQLQATRAAPDPTARYYYALLAMAAGMGTMAAMSSIRKLQPTSDAVGARYCMGAVPRWRVLLGTFLAAWLCQFACMMVAMAFMWGVASVPFGDQAGLVVLAVALCSLAGCATGSFLGTIPRLPVSIASAITCVLSLFTGLYGSMSLADDIATSMPALAYLNPLWQMTNCFYALLYYDTYDTYIASCAALLAMAAVFMALTTVGARRLSHEHL
ncbi:MAG: ABC transporter permease [Atopobiaceae bacterium]